MRVLFLGDVVGRTARKAALNALASLREEVKADFVLVNVENAAGGFGVTPDIADAFLAAGADAMTTGNHVWDKREIIAYIEREPRLLRPLNMAEGTPGAGITIINNAGGKRLGVINLMTNLFMAPSDDMFNALKSALHKVKLGRDADAILIDVHGEATSEKAAIGFLADGLVSVVLGTHTHVPTADHRIMPKGTAFMSDVGMCGDYVSVIGMEADSAIGRFFGGKKARLEVAAGEPTLCGVIVDIDEASGLARAIHPFRRGGVLEPTTLPFQGLRGAQGA